MALTSTEKNDLLDDMYRALYSGALRVQMGDRTIQYRTATDLKRAIEMLEADIAGTLSDRQEANVYKPKYQRGFKES